jgi:O-antigen/teichoic acid export membrane protein
LVSSIFIGSIYFFNEDIVKLISGAYNPHTSSVLVIISISILSSPLGTLFTQSFIIKNKTSEFLKVLQFTFLTNMIFVFPLIYFYEELGLAYTVFITQIIHIALNIYFTQKVNKGITQCVA